MDGFSKCSFRAYAPSMDFPTLRFLRAMIKKAWNEGKASRSLEHEVGGALGRLTHSVYQARTRWEHRHLLAPNMKPIERIKTQSARFKKTYQEARWPVVRVGSPIFNILKARTLYWVLGLGVFAGGIFLYSANQIDFEAQTRDKGEAIVYVAPGTAAGRIPALMQQAGVDVNSFYFRVLMRLSGTDRNLHSGYYRILPEDTVSSIVDRLSEGQAVLFSWRIADGATYWEVRKSLNELEGVKHDSKNLSNEELLFAIGAKEKHLEGLFAPDTYNLHADVSDLRILKKAYDQQQEILTQEWSNRSADCVVKTPYEALILASIVEREVGRAQDRAIVAGIFSNRLRIKMPLQTDPTVIYGIGENFDGDITRKHLRTKTPYNTYHFIGLPPTPIGNPTRESIHAVLHPAKTEFLYFINKPNGDLVTSKTLEEHNRAVNRYLLRKGQ